ncbi:hypothetical protein C5167_049239 [Papaver somniferum]|uniref:Uncharacterized protein n=1 Tax=Papaver somniferum TaxID=3469 RepID=A0A4Y7KNT7_PAPSO|nr:hypothetical protein C5167_049239 [Papaver somniferum]
MTDQLIMSRKENFGGHIIK